MHKYQSGVPSAVGNVSAYGYAVRSRSRSAAYGMRHGSLSHPLVAVFDVISVGLLGLYSCPWSVSVLGLEHDVSEISVVTGGSNC